MPCINVCESATEATKTGNVYTCNGSMKAQIGKCQYPTACRDSYYPVGHYVKVNEFPSKGVGNYVYAYEAMNCADKISEVGILGAEQCQLKRGISVTMKQMPDSAMFYGRVANAIGTVPGTEIKIGYTDDEGKFWTLWSEGVDGGASVLGTGDYDLNGVVYSTGIASKPSTMPASGIYGSIIGSGNDQGTSVGILFSTLPTGTAGVYTKIGVYGAPCYGVQDTAEAYGGMFVVRNSAGVNIDGTMAVLGMKVGNIIRAASFQGRVHIGTLGLISRDQAGLGEVYVDGETLKVRLT